MYEAFSSAFSPDRNGRVRPAAPAVSLADDHLRSLLLKFGGESFNKGQYRIISVDKFDHWNEQVGTAFPDYVGRIACFGFDWLGRFFASDSARSVEGRPGVSMFEPGTGEVLQIPCNIQSFHDSEVVEYREQALADGFYKEWLASGGAAPAYAQCIGYKRPLFLGGKDKIENLEVCDLEVYWDLAGQLLRQVRGLPPGSPIGKISIS